MTVPIGTDIFIVKQLIKKEMTQKPPTKKQFPIWFQDGELHSRLKAEAALEGKHLYEYTTALLWKALSREGVGNAGQ